MPTDLERIEARHLERCDLCLHGKQDHCATVKLARALDEVRPLLKLAAFGEATDLMLEMGAASIERTLHEVAGGDDAE